MAASGSPDRPSYVLVPHTADLAFEVEAPSWAALLSAAALAVSDVVRARTPGGSEERRVSVDGDAREDVLVAWLSEVLYWFERDGFLPSSVTIERATSGSVSGVLRGARFPASTAPPDRVVKAVTYHDLHVGEGDGVHPWRARVVLDL